MHNAMAPHALPPLAALVADGPGFKIQANACQDRIHRGMAQHARQPLTALISDGPGYEIQPNACHQRSHRGTPHRRVVRARRRPFPSAGTHSCISPAVLKSPTVVTPPPLGSGGYAVSSQGHSERRDTKVSPTDRHVETEPADPSPDSHGFADAFRSSSVRNVTVKALGEAEDPAFLVDEEYGNHHKLVCN